jgi:hypothetical protein
MSLAQRAQGRLAVRLTTLALGLTALACVRVTAAPTPRQAPELPTIAPTSPPSGRVLSISATPRLDPAPGPADFLTAFQMAYDAGARGAFSSWTWATLEPSAGRFDLKKAIDDLEFQGRGRNMVLLVGIQAINTTAKETPSDLATTTFDAPEMTARFHALINALLPNLDSHVRYISIGNEVDVYLAAHPAEWDAYQVFLEDGIAYVHSVAPWIRVGTTVTFGGASGANGDHIATLTRKSDILILTYYPLQANFAALPPASPDTDFPRMLRLAGDRPVVLQEVGYPSAESLSSSEQAQAEFVTSVFRAWAAEGERIPFLNYFALHDFSPALCGQMMDYYGLHEVNFEAYLCSLGLRRTNGDAKAAWQTFVEQTKATGLP